MEFDTNGQRWATWLLWKEGVSGSDIHRRLVSTCGEGAPCERTVRNWITDFHGGKTTTDDRPRSGRPATAVTHANVMQIEQMIQEDPRSTVRETSARI